MSLPDSNHQPVSSAALVGLVEIEGFYGGPTMVFKSEPDSEGRQKRIVAPSVDGPAAEKAAVVDLSESLSQLYDQALRLGHSEAALFIGCASLSISETVAMERLNTQECAAVPKQSQKSCCDD